MGQADDMCITVAWDQAPHWGKKKKINVGEKKKSKKKPSGSLGRGKSGGLSSLPRTPLGSLRSPTFFLFDPVFCLFPALRSLVPG